MITVSKEAKCTMEIEDGYTTLECFDEIKPGFNIPIGGLGAPKDYICGQLYVNRENGEVTWACSMPKGDSEFAACMYRETQIGAKDIDFTDAAFAVVNASLFDAKIAIAAIRAGVYLEA